MNRPENGESPRGAYISRACELDLIRKAKAGESKAFEALLAAGEGLMTRWAAMLMNYREDEIKFEELMEAGKEGAWEALKRFNERYGVRFMTYAQYWIKITMRKHIKAKLIPKKSTGSKIISDILHVKFDYFLLNGREPEYEEIAEILNRDSEKKITAKEVEMELWRSESTTFPESLSRPLGDDEDAGTYEDILSDPFGAQPDENMLGAECREVAEKALKQIGKKKPRYEKILRNRFGIGREEKTLQQVGGPHEADQGAD